MKLVSVSIALFGVLSTLFALLGVRAHYFEHNTCSMSWSQPVYVPLDVPAPNAKVDQKYHVYAYREGSETPLFESADDAANLRGTPVLFLPGNAGSYEQGRSLAATSSANLQYDWFLVDFDADLSAFYGKTLLDEAAFVNDAIAYILDLYKFHSNRPESVVVVAHSMGGVVARTLPTMNNYIAHSVNTIITLSTPHVYPPVTFDRDVTQLYDLVNQWWRYTDHGIALISIAGGHNDMLVLPDTAIVDSLNGLTLFTYELDSLRAGIDHLAIVWCGELREHVCAALESVIAPHEGRRTLEQKDVLAAFSREFKQSPLSHMYPQLLAPTNLLFGKSLNLAISGPIDISLPVRSSLVSYRVSASAPVQLTHYTRYEYRKYGPENVVDPLITDETVMWYSAGPYVPFRLNNDKNDKTESGESGESGEFAYDDGTGIPPLRIQIVPSFPDTEVVITVAWQATLANVAVHYRTLAACWPFAVIVLATLSLALKKDKASFTAVLHETIAKTMPCIAVLLAITHCALGSHRFRAFVRALQYPSESANSASLAYIKHDVHDMLLGHDIVELVWIVFVLLATACAAALIMHYVVLGIVYCRHVFNLRLRRARFTTPKFSKQLTARAKLAISLVLGSTVLYFVPYQVSTVLLAVYELLSLDVHSAYELAFAEMLVWVAIVDAPITAVWLDNANWRWLRAFASLKNVSAALPLYVYVLRGSPFPTKSPLLLKWLTFGVFLYCAVFAFVYGGLHAFMVHHLTCYLALWLLAASFDSARSVA